MSSRKLLAAFLLCAPLLLAGCGPKTSEVLDKVRPQYEPLRARLRQIAAELPPPSPLPPDPQSKKLDPKPVLRDDGRGNLVFFHASQVADSKARVDEGKDLDLILSGELSSLLGWTAQPSTLSSSVLEARGDKDFPARLEAIRSRVRYLGMYRAAEYEPPVAVDEKSFRGGRVAMDFFVYDLNDGKLLAQWRLTARPNETVEYSYRKGESQTAALESWARSSIWSNLRKALFGSLPERIGGEYMDRK